MSQEANSYVANAMDRWSGAFFKLTLPSGLGKKATIKQCTDEGAKVLSMNVYMARRSATADAVPYDGSTYEGHTVKDETTGTLWNYETNFPEGFQETSGEKFNVSLGHVFKCSDCRGQGRVRCSECNGRVRWQEKRGNEVISYNCNCGDGKMDCHTCTGYGTMLRVLKVTTRYANQEKRAKEYSGRLPEELLMGSQGNNIYRHVSEFDKRVITEAIDGFETEEYESLMRDVHAELKNDVATRVAHQMANPMILEGLIDGYFQELPNPVAANKRLSDEVLPVRMKCEVTDVPVTAVAYEYKGNEYSVYVYGSDGKIWPHGKQPSEFTWKIGILLGLVSAVAIGILISQLIK